MKIKIKTPQEAWERFNQSTQAVLGISADEFERRLNQGEYDSPEDNDSNSSIVYLKMIMPLKECEGY